VKLLGLEIRKYGTVPATISRDGARAGVIGRDAAVPWDYADVWEGGDDVSPDLHGRQKFQIYREMRQTDPAIRSLDWMFRLPIRAAEWTVVPAEDDPDGESISRARADFASWQFGLERHVGSGRLDLSWDDYLTQDLFYLSYGSMGGEIVWASERGKVKIETWRDADGDEHQVIPIARIAPRFPATVAQILTDDQTGAITRIRQDVLGQPGDGWIPGEKVTWLCNEREGSNYWGLSLYRSAVGAWKLKQNTMVSGAIALDRWASPTPLVRHPPGATAERKAEEIGRGIRTHERSWITMEGPKPPDGNWDVDIVDTTGTLPDPVAFLRHLDGQIAMSGLQQFSQLGTSERGSRAVGDSLSDPFYQALTAIAGQISEMRMRMVVRRLWDLNFGEHVPIPTITASKIQGKNIAVLARALADLTSAGLSFADQDTQNDVRDILDLRHLPEAAARAVQQLPGDVGLQPAPGRVIPVEGGTVTGGLA
jgi:hypothetical protein